MTNFRKACLKFAGSLALALTASVLSPERAPAQDAPERQSSPDGRILFQSTQGSDGYVNEIYTMDADGRRQVRLTYNEVDDATPTWSPQGDRIAFLSLRGEAGYAIYLMNPDGTGERPLREAADGGPLVANNIQWSPDGTRIMYAAGGRIYVAEVTAPGGGYSTAPVLNLSASAPDYAHDGSPAWSPDGSRVAFISNNCAGCYPDVFVVNSDGTGRAQVTTSFDAEFAPRWTPAGRIAYGALRGSSRTTYVANADGTGEQPLAAGVAEALSPVWSPDGTRVLFTSTGPLAAPQAGLYVMNADGSGLTFLTDEANGGGEKVWSPDGTRILAHAVNDLGWVDLIAFDAAGTRRRVTNMTKTRKADEYACSWQTTAAQ